MSATEILTQSTPTTQTPNAEPNPQSAHQLDPSTSANSQWYGNITNPELKTWLTNKAYASPERLAESARSLEQLLGADRAGRTVVLPKDDADVEGQKAFFSKIGVPETPEGYKLPLPDGDNGEFAKTAASWFHKAGVPAKAAETIATQWNEFIAAEVAKGEQADKTKSEADLQNLKIEWADKFDTNSELGRRGLALVGKNAGLDDGDLKIIESSLGTAKMLKMFQKIGEFGQEAGFSGSDGNASFGMSPTQARTTYDQHMADRAAGKINTFTWNTEYMNKGGKIEQLMKAMGVKVE